MFEFLKWHDYKNNLDFTNQALEMMLEIVRFLEAQNGFERGGDFSSVERLIEKNKRMLGE